MGLDNFWLIPKQTEENLAVFSNAPQTKESPENVEFENVEYHGKHAINLVGGFFTSNGNGSFRGKYYSALCDAMLNESDWLYNFHFKSEIEDAYEVMKDFLDKFQGEDAHQHWEEFVSKSRKTVVDHYGCFDEYTMDEAIDFIRMFEYYSTVENICLSAWY
jgi:hypothetical protein